MNENVSASDAYKYEGYLRADDIIALFGDVKSDGSVTPTTLDIYRPNLRNINWAIRYNNNVDVSGYSTHTQSLVIKPSGSNVSIDIGKDNIGHSIRGTGSAVFGTAQHDSAYIQIGDHKLFLAQPASGIASNGDIGIW